MLLDAGAEIVGDCRALDEDGLAVCTAQTIELKDLGIRGGQLQYFRKPCVRRRNLLIQNKGGGNGVKFAHIRTKIIEVVDRTLHFRLRNE